MTSRPAKRYANEIADHSCDRLDREELREKLAAAFEAGAAHAARQPKPKEAK